MKSVADQNPYARIRELTGFGQREFARKAKISRPTLVQIETGQFADLSEKMVLLLSQACATKGISLHGIVMNEYNAETLQSAYHNWQSNERRKNSELFQIRPPDQSTKDLSPFHFYIKETTGSAQGFAKKLKVPSAAVTRYAAGVTKAMPKAIEDALRSIHYDYLQTLLSMQEEWNSR